MKRLVRIDHERYAELQFTGLGKNMAIAKHSPADEKAATWANNELDLAVMAVETLNDAVSKAAEDNNLSPAGRLAKVQPIQANVKDTIAGVWKQAKKEQDDVASSREALLAPPALDPTNAVGVLEDIEVRSRFQAMTASDRAVVLNGQDRASLGRVLLALRRDPINSSDRQQAEALWGAFVASTQQDAIDKLDARERIASWLLQSLNNLSTVVDAAVPLGMTGIRAAA